MRSLPEICKWKYQDLLELPSNETEIYEYKSSKISLDKLKNEISIAASAFWNSGGGIFVAGVSDAGEVDGGIPNKNGRQSIRDWVDNALKLTEPSGEYQIHTIEKTNCTDNIIGDNIVLIIRFDESTLVPHMAYDKKYYIRIGAHSDGASHFLVEALRSLRNYSKPNLKGIMKFHRSKPQVVELVIVSINDAVALDVEITFSPYPKALAEHFIDKFPLQVALVDKHNPFIMDISIFGARGQVFGEEPVKLILKYIDAIGNNYVTEQIISPQKNLQPMVLGDDKIVKLTKAIEKLADKL